MDTFEFLSVLFSVVLGLALTQILQGLRALMLARSRVVLYWPALLWVVLMITVLVQVWWSMFGMQSIRNWTFLMYAAVMLQITIIYLASALVIPDLPPEGAFDMRKAYYAHAGWFFALMALTVASTFVKDILTVGHIILGWNAWYLGLSFVLFAVAALTRWRWYHAILAPFSLAAVAVNTGLLSMAP